MNEPGEIQYDIDFRTGFPTSITSDATGWAIRTACAALNKQRARGIMEAAKFNAPGEQIQTDVWATDFEREAKHWEVPLINLGKLGISHDKDGFRSTDFLSELTPGAEAAPYFDEEARVVYKLFDLKANGALGKKIVLKRNQEGMFQIEHQDATLEDTMQKLSVLNAAGAHATEIVGLSEEGDYLIAKQPLAYPYKDLKGDTDLAVQKVRGIVPLGPSLGYTVAVTWVLDQAWFVGDLHERNIMRDSNDVPTIIDALTGTIPIQATKEISSLFVAIQDAKDYRKTGQPPLRKPFEEVDDDEL